MSNQANQEGENLLYPHQSRNLSRLRLIVIIGSMYFGEFFTALDSTVVTTLLSHIASDLNELSRVVWIATGYLIAFAACQPLYGKISDIFGRKAVLIVCNVLFALGCGICGISNNLETLVLGRVISGIGGGGMQSLATIAVSDLIPLKNRGLLQGIENIFFSVGAGLGGVLGGILTDLFGWKNVFNIQIPFIVLSIIVLIVFYNVEDEVREEEAIIQPQEPGSTLYGTVHNGDMAPPTSQEKTMKEKVNRVDFAGSGLLVLSLCLVMFVISTGGSEFDWTGPVITAMAIGSVLAIGGFIYVEAYVAKEPVIPLVLFTNKTILTASFVNLFCAMAMYNVLYFAPIYYSAVFGLTPTELGQRLSTHFVGSAGGAFLAGLYVSKAEKYKGITILSSIILTIGASIVVLIRRDSPSSLQFLVFYLCGTGYSAILTVTLLAYIASVPREMQAVVTSVRYVFRGTGTTLGVSIASSIFNNLLTQQLHEKVVGDDAESIISKVKNSVEAIWKIPAEYRPAVIDAYNFSLKTTLTVGMAFAVCSVIASLFLKEYRLT